MPVAPIRGYGFGLQFAGPSDVAVTVVLWQYRRVSSLSMNDGEESFEVTVFEATPPSVIVLFAVGRGGNPDRHLPLLRCLFDQGCTVVAPHFERLLSPTPSERDLLLRGRRLSLALDTVARPGLLVAGVGHSIGATMLLALAGGQVWLRSGRCLPTITDARLDRLVLFAPATGFFQCPGALDAVRTPIRAWVGTNDVITPPAQTNFLKEGLGDRVSVEVKVVDGAGHFSFMNELPPQISDPLPNREAFLDSLAADLGAFVMA